MKRRISLSEGVEPIPLPLELVIEIAKQYEPKSLKDIYLFMLICKTAQLSIEHFLEKWAMHIFKEKRTNPEYRRIQSFYYQIRKNRIADIDMVWTKEKKREGGVRKEFLEALFSLTREVYCDEFHFRTFQGEEHPRVGYHSYRCSNYKYNAKTHLHELFYYNQENDTIIPLKRLEGLKILEISQKTKIKEELILLLEGRVLPSVRKLCEKSLMNMKEAELKSFYYEMRKDLGKPLKIHKPHKSSLVSNAIINGKHLFSDSPETSKIHSNLYYCHSNKSTKERMNLLYLFVTRERRYKEILDILDVEKPSYQVAAIQFFQCGTC